MSKRTRRKQINWRKLGKAWLLAQDRLNYGTGKRVFESWIADVPPYRLQDERLLN